jgi:hypothetical protein
LYMTFLLHSLALFFFLLACGLVLALVLAYLSDHIRSWRYREELFICPVLDDGYGFLVE